MSKKAKEVAIVIVSVVFAVIIGLGVGGALAPQSQAYAYTCNESGCSGGGWDNGDCEYNFCYDCDDGWFSDCSQSTCPQCIAVE